MPPHLRPASRPAFPPHGARILAALALAMLATAAHAQGNHALFTADGHDVWAVGDSGRWYRSYDADSSWTFGTLGAQALRAVEQRQLQVVIAADSGIIWTSANGGGAWAQHVVTGAPALRAAAMPSDVAWLVAGDGGTIARSIDQGATWTNVASGTAGRIDAIAFGDAAHGWIAGAGGFLAHTFDAGATWTPVTLGTSGELLAVSQRGSTVLVGGADGTAWRSSDNGAHWTALRLRLPGRADVRAVWAQSQDTLYIGGGGGFVWRSVDAGSTWIPLQHAMHGSISALAFAGGRGFAASDRHRMVFATIDRGTTWSMPVGGTLTRSWASKLSTGASVRGSGLAINPQNRATLYCLMGTQVYASRNQGETWQAQGLPIPGGTQSNAFLVSPKDTNVFVAAAVFSSAPMRRIVRSTDGGQTWTDRLDHDFGEYGIPLAMHPDKPDTLYFGGTADSLWRSTDFGLTWAPWGTRGFRDPCVIVVTPDSGSIVLVGDGTTGTGLGQIWRSTDDAQTFSLRWTNPGTGSEVPQMATSRLRNGTTFATNWGSGGVERSTDYGATWPNVTTTANAWGVGVAGDDPNVVIYGVFFTSISYLSLDGGATFPNTNSLPGANYSFMLPDRGLVLAEQNLGVYKMAFAYAFTPDNTQSLAVSAPAGGETWAAGSVHAVKWNAVHTAVARVEYRRSPADPWLLIANVPAWTGSYGWTVPADPTTQAQVRVSDAWDGAPVSISSAFTIQAPAFAASPTSMAFGSIPAGTDSSRTLTISNAGPVALTITNVTTNTGDFYPGRRSLTIAAGSSDTVSVTFAPTAALARLDTLRFTSNAPGSPQAVPLSGTGTRAALWWEYPGRADVGVVSVGGYGYDPIQFHNAGLDTLKVTVGSSRPTFRVTRASFVVRPGFSDTLGIVFTPAGAGKDSALLTFSTNDAAGSHVVTALGQGTTVTDAGAPGMSGFALAAPMPNPCATRSLIRYALPRAGDVTLELFHIDGRRVATLVSGVQEPGWHEVAIDAVRLRLGSGIYFCRLECAGSIAGRKLLVLR